MTANTSEPSNEEKIWQIISQIPSGKVVTYGQVAELAGIGRGARLVGHTLKKLPEDSHLPWHRVVNAAGKISLRTHSEGHNEQQRRLEEEGVVLLKGKINLSLYRWLP